MTTLAVCIVLLGLITVISESVENESLGQRKRDMRRPSEHLRGITTALSAVLVLWVIYKGVDWRG